MHGGVCGQCPQQRVAFRDGAVNGISAACCPGTAGRRRPVPSSRRRLRPGALRAAGCRRRPGRRPTPVPAWPVRPQSQSGVSVPETAASCTIASTAAGCAWPAAMRCRLESIKSPAPLSIPNPGHPAGRPETYRHKLRAWASCASASSPPARSARRTPSGGGRSQSCRTARAGVVRQSGTGRWPTGFAACRRCHPRSAPDDAGPRPAAQ